jgi:hypothetical protein
MVIVQVGFDRRVVKRTKSQASSGGLNGNVGRYWDTTRVSGSRSRNIFYDRRTTASGGYRCKSRKSNHPLGLFASRLEQRLLEINLRCDRIEQRADPRPAVNEQDDQQQLLRCANLALQYRRI